MIVGGTTSVIGGGKFANGATSAAFVYLFNDLAHWREVELRDLDRLRNAGYTVLEQVKLNITDVAGKSISVIADSVAMKGDQLIISEVKDGLGAKLSAGQRAMFSAALGEGKIAIASSEVARQLGLKAGVDIFAQSSRLTQIAVRLEAMSGSRAVGQLMRIGGGGVLGGALRVIGGVGGALATFTGELQ